MISNLLNKLFGKEPLDFKGQSIQLVDVRTSKEYESGSVDKAINIPLSKVSNSLSQFSKTDTIVVFCRSGARSGKAKKILTQNGYTNVINGGSWNAVKGYLDA
jgi:rhodanese-related sulfurtransferase